MKVVGTICEYNPFHNGHLYSLRKIKELAKPDILVVCMSTYFTMRGDLSLHLPKEKTKYALTEADLVIALPSILACNNATRFGDFAVKELNKVGVSKIYCGSESADLSLIDKDNIDDIKLDKNISYKKATSKILNLGPNDILAYSYLSSIKKNNFNIKLNLIKRTAPHHDSFINSDIYTSSSNIRENLSLLDKYSPSFVSKDILDYELLFPYFKYVINIYNDFSNIAFIKDGIEKHIYNNLNKANSFKELIELSTNSYFTKTKIKRAIFYILFNIHSYDYNYPYTKILGFNKKGQNYLNQIKKDIKLVTNTKTDISNILNEELKIANILNIVYGKDIFKNEIDKPIIID